MTEEEKLTEAIEKMNMYYEELHDAILDISDVSMRDKPEISSKLEKYLIENHEKDRFEIASDIVNIVKDNVKVEGF